MSADKRRIAQLVHAHSRRSYGQTHSRRAHTRIGIEFGRGHVEPLMQRYGIQGLSGRRKWRRVPGYETAVDLLDRRFTRDSPNELWATGITGHLTREGRVYCAIVLDAFSRRVVGWSIDSCATAALVTNALGMAIDARAPSAPSSTATRARKVNSPHGLHATGAGLRTRAILGLGRRLLRQTA